MHEATSADPHTLATTRGRRWSHGVAFNGAGVADITYWDGDLLHVIEAKGGGSKLGERKQSRFHKDTSPIDGVTSTSDADAYPALGWLSHEEITEALAHATHPAAVGADSEDTDLLDTVLAALQGCATDLVTIYS